MSQLNAEKSMNRQPPKVSIIGAGMVGSTLGYRLVVERVASEAVLVDINHDRAEGDRYLGRTNSSEGQLVQSS